MTIQLVSEFWVDGDEAYDGIRIIVNNNGKTIFSKKYYFMEIESEDPYHYCNAILKSMAKSLKAKILPASVEHLGKPL